ncbi:hypothetical protein INS49_007121 [Diaporthe citri]|uniref:uncharacterized protein n=1 Tax=Diaporthe citri TaxID=83186 RepID=UPI001C80BA5A|nr:uncharacterized protein INS49_007121 [Diaporthe citri]KAG6365510.1 hypothetical protein INS49_007121 [Diaporthe citri]
MDAAANTPRRSSCDRCRTQKLRCVPSSGTNSPAPCERCSRAKLSKSCIFSNRSRAGRHKQSSDVDSRALPKTTGLATATIPGMSAFALCDIESPSGSSIQTKQSPSRLAQVPGNDTPVMVGVDGDAADAQTEMPSELWGHEDRIFNSLCLDLPLSHSEPSNFLDGAEDSYDFNTKIPELPDGITASAKTDSNTFAMARYLEAQDLLLGPKHAPPIAAAPTTMEDAMDTDTTISNPAGSLLELAALVSSLSQYENDLSALPAYSPSEIDNFPIGDALSLSQRFLSAILHDHQDDPSARDMPLILLTLTCYMKLMRVYSSVFDYLHDHLKYLLAANETYHSPRLAPWDINAYRGLRLSQLRPICLCAGWAPIRKAVSLMLGLLGRVEGVLGLPADVRVAAIHQADAGGKGCEASSFQGSVINDGERAILFEGSLMNSLTDRRLYKSVEEHTGQLKEKVSNVEAMLKRYEER